MRLIALIMALTLFICMLFFKVNQKYHISRPKIVVSENVTNITTLSHCWDIIEKGSKQKDIEKQFNINCERYL